MARLSVAVVAVLSGRFGLISAQYSGWQQDQVSASMCLWKAPRAAIVRDTLYVNGGELYWIPGLGDGSFGAVTSDDNPRGLMYSFNFSTPFSTSQNLTALFTVQSMAPGGQSNANNVAPNYVDGAALSNDDELFFYGGLVRDTDAFPAPFAQEVWEYQTGQYGPVRPSFSPGFIDAQLPTAMTRYLAYGAVSAAPSEQLAWYISGMASPTHGPIYQIANDSYSAVNLSATLITLDMAIQQHEMWTKTTLPASARPRAAAQAVWLPVGSRGIVVVVGGITYPEFASTSPDPNELARAGTQSSSFMTTVDILDVASGIWYRQNTTDAPTGRCRGCAIGTAARDGSSFNIYYYGGYNGTDPTQDFSDEVWVLSLPSFSWTRLSSGTTNHARAGHVCVRPYPDRMFVLGGYTPETGVELNCLDGGVIQLLNLTDGSWMSQYDPAIYSEYSVPTAVQSVIGGGPNGHATVTAPLPSGAWQTAALAEVFKTAYPTSKIATWYPYNRTQPAASATPSAAVASATSGTSGNGGGGGGLPPWVAPVLGVILGLILVILCAIAIFVWLRRSSWYRARARRRDENGTRILSWMHAHETKSPAGATSEDASGPPPSDTLSDPGISSPTTAPSIRLPAETESGPRHEMENTGIAELMDTSPPVELQDTGLSPMDIINRHSHFAPGATWRVPNPSSVYSSAFETDASSDISGPRVNTSMMDHPGLRGSAGADADATGGIGTGIGAVADNPGRFLSGVSAMSNRDLAHLRHVSDETVSSAGFDGESANLTGHIDGRSVANPSSPSISPVSPSTPGPSFGQIRSGDPSDGSHSPAPVRRSIFRESAEDMGHRL